MQCPSCGAPVTGAVCPYCGNRLAFGNAQTSTINAQNVVVNNYYGQDQQGAPQRAVPVIAEVVPTVSSKSRALTLILCIMLGILGVHRFYVGRVGLGVLFLLTFGCLGIGWLVDIVLACMGVMQDGKGLPVSKW